MRSNRHPLTQTVLVKLTPDQRRRAAAEAERRDLPLATFIRGILVDVVGEDEAQAA
ncbi:hypothetical protein [Aureimonas sp. SK2]|uniref:hypothetical protein n=1 Tax=Aureimonas sp. SK2 TaxID=3015992 RepID=UPI002444BAAF|nr:hypothetical protein [Aureimonas sp. SK2]